MEAFSTMKDINNTLDRTSLFVALTNASLQQKSQALIKMAFFQIESIQKQSEITIFTPKSYFTDTSP